MPDIRTVEFRDEMILIQNRRNTDRCKVGAYHSLDEFWDRYFGNPYGHDIDGYIHPDDPRSLGRCALCGEGVGERMEPAEMYGEPKPKNGVGELVDYGLVHAQCGLDAGWEIA